jgi:hypothetical protein
VTQAPPVHLTDKTRELLRLLASDPVMAQALYCAVGMVASPAVAMLKVSTLEDSEWKELEEKYRG